MRKISLISTTAVLLAGAPFGLALAEEGAPVAAAPEVAALGAQPEAAAVELVPAELGGDGLAQDEEDEESVESETNAVRTGDLDDNVGTTKEVTFEEDDKKKKTVIKTIARKNFMKLGRFEASPHFAFVANDPFLNRYIVGTGFGYHVTEIFAVEANLDFAPDLGDGDWKPLTHQLVEQNNVSPDISKLTLFGNLGFQYSPIYGKVALVGRKLINFDVYGAFGMGFTKTTDDLQALGEEDEAALATQNQTHPTTNFGGGIRVIFGESIAARVEARSLVYIETVSATTLEMKNNLILQGAVSFFFPNIK
jgi:outer membrane beta-barrel protein